MKLLVTFLSLMSISLTATAEADLFQGQYLKSVQVAADMTCFPLAHPVCWEEVTDNVSIMKSEHSAEIYDVSIFTQSGLMNTCEFNGSMVLNNGRLQVQSQESGCTIEIDRTESGIKVLARSCAAHCNGPVTLSGSYSKAD